MEKLKPEHFCVVTAPYLHHTLEFGLDSIAASGFQNIELWGASPHYCYNDYTQQERKERITQIVRLLRDRGLSMPVFYPEQMRQYTINIASPDPYIQKQSLRLMEEYLEDTVSFGASRMVLTPGWEYLDDPRKENYQRSLDSMAKLATRAEELGITLVVEVLPRIQSAFAYNLETLRQMVDDVGLSHLQVCIDVVAMHEENKTVDDYFSVFGCKVAHIHLADHSSSGSLPLGEGNTEVEADLHVLEKHDYDGYVSINLCGATYYVNPDRGVFTSGRWLKGHHFL